MRPLAATEIRGTERMKMEIYLMNPEYPARMMKRTQRYRGLRNGTKTTKIP